MSSPDKPRRVCETCGGSYALAKNVSARFCSFRCQAAYARRVKAARAEPERVSAPPAPDLSDGLCVIAPPHQRGYWTSRSQPERTAARRLCERCPVIAACREWSLTLPVTDTAVYGGMSHEQRLAARRERQVAAS